MGSAKSTFVKRPLVALAVVAMVVGLGGTAVQAAPVSALQVERTRMNDLIEQVDGDRSMFAGISFDESSGVATVRYPAAKGARAAQERLARLGSARPGTAANAATSWRVTFTPVRYSAAELDAALTRLRSSAEWRRLAGKLLSQWYVDIERNVAAVGLTTVTPAVRDMTRRLFGDMVQLHVAGLGSPTTRPDDFEPWHAGARIFASLGGCTTGFVIEEINNPANRAMATAGHCGNLGDNVTNNGDSIGTIVVRHLDQNGLDLAFVHGRPYFPFAYTGPPDSATGLNISGTTLPAVGLNICNDGATTGQDCAGRVNATNICVRFTDGITRCGVARAGTTDGTRLVAGGDSGGPVITLNGALRLTGMVIGEAPVGVGTTMFFHPFNRLLPTGWRVATA